MLKSIFVFLNPFGFSFAQIMRLLLKNGVISVEWWWTNTNQHKLYYFIFHPKAHLKFIAFLFYSFLLLNYWCNSSIKFPEFIVSPVTAKKSICVCNIAIYSVFNTFTHMQKKLFILNRLYKSANAVTFKTAELEPFTS